MKVTSNRILSIFAVIIVTVSFYFTVHFAQSAATAKANRKEDRIILTLRQQNAVLGQQKQDLRAVCLDEISTWDTFQRLIASATNPPSRAGTKLTEEQKVALAAYRQGLIDSVGAKPTC